ncbi:MAG: 30S ribosomal protein S12 methylthiotransferase RimO [Spirochaetaceae bacterium]|jgi:ribosomal protein S12 methylthiotransferase|nr:30S ribosomal protein S12 methylthiotransferase RimO [Spirochaetaceae bacterium]
MARYYLDPFGCVKNQVDAETMMGTLDKSGWAAAGDPAEADLIIINSCGFIKKAKQESINAVLRYKKAYPEKKVLLAGCLAQRYVSELAESLPEADMLFGNQDLSRITDAAYSALRGEGRTLVPEPGPGEKAGALSPAGERPLLSLPGSAYVKISEGCNNRCSFCAIPLIRGPLRSRPADRIIRECRRLLDRGVVELNLIGQDLGSYGADTRLTGRETGLPRLLEALSRLDGNFWIRLLYIHPDNFPRPILDIIRQDRRFLPYFDLPFQHGSSGILRAMNRRGDPQTYLSLIEEIRSALPDGVIRSTFLTGFPGETEEDFLALLDFQEKARLDWLGVFAYSREEDTPAYALKGRVPGKIAAARKARIETQQIPITQERMEHFIGREMAVLVEEEFTPAASALPGEGNLYLGRLFSQAPEVDGAAVITSGEELVPGTLIQGRVFARAGFDLEVAALPKGKP